MEGGDGWRRGRGLRKERDGGRRGMEGGEGLRKERDGGRRGREGWEFCKLVGFLTLD